VTSTIVYFFRCSSKVHRCLFGPEEAGGLIFVWGLGDGGTSDAFLVELVFVLSGPSLARSGSVRIALPTFDLPVCNMMMSIAAPSECADQSDSCCVSA
jgi:hypothetical protein